MKKVWIAMVCMLCVLALGAGVVGCSKVSNTHIEDKPVDKPVETAEATPAPAVDETLEEVEGTPDDLGEVYDEAGDAETEPQSIYKVVPIDENVINILLIGQNKGLDWEKAKATDSYVLVSYNREKQSVKMLSIMRDTWVNIEGHGWNRLSAAYTYGGPGLLINTINELYGLDIQNYALIGMEEFTACIDKLGGIEMELTKEEVKFINKKLKTDLKEGANHLTGEMALTHALNNTTKNGDFDRTARLKNVIETSYKKLRTEGDLTAYLGFVQYGLENIRTNMDLDKVITLSMEVLQADKLETAYAHAPFDGAWKYAKKNGRSVISVDIEENKKQIQQFLYGE